MILAHKLRGAAPAPVANVPLTVTFLDWGTVLPSGGSGTVTGLSTSGLGTWDLVVAVVVAWDAIQVGQSVSDVKMGGSGGTSMTEDVAQVAVPASLNWINASIWSLPNDGTASSIYVESFTGSADTFVVGLYGVAGTNADVSTKGANATRFVQEREYIDGQDSDSYNLGNVSNSANVLAACSWTEAFGNSQISLSTLTTDLQRGTTSTRFAYTFGSQSGAAGVGTASLSSNADVLVIAGASYTLP